MIEKATTHIKGSTFSHLEGPLTSNAVENLTHKHQKFDPEQRGWKIDGDVLTPVMTDIAGAPGSTLNFVRCWC